MTFSRIKQHLLAIWLVSSCIQVGNSLNFKGCLIVTNEYQRGYFANFSFWSSCL